VLERLTRTVIRFRWAVIPAWILIFFVSFILMGRLNDLFQERVSLPGTDVQRAEDVLDSSFGKNSSGSFTLVARDESRPATEFAPAVGEAAERAARELPSGQVASVQAISDHVVSAEIVSNLDQLDAKDYTDDMRNAAGAIPGAESWLTGGPAIQSDAEPVSNEDLKVGEFYIALPIALAVLVFVFATLAFLIPLIFAMVAIPATLALVWVFAHYIDMQSAVRNLVFLIGLGIAIDYSLIVVYRFREELRAGHAKEQAVVNTMKTAGHAVVFSGTAVAIGLALLMFVPVPLIRGFGVAGLLIPLVSVACALTLLPVLLYSLEGRLDRVRLVPKRVLVRRESATESNLWVRLAHRIMRQPLLFLAISLTLLVAAAAPVVSLDLGPGTNEELPPQLESTQGLRILQEASGGGAIAPVEIVIDTGRAGGFDEPAFQLAESNFFQSLGEDPEVGARSDFAHGRQFLDPTRRYVHVQATARHDAGVPESDALVRRIREEIVPASEFPAGTEVYVGGGPAGGVDFLDKTYSAFPFLVAAVLVLTYFLLLRAFRSLLLPLKAIVLNLLSVAAAFGIMVAAFQWGAGEPFGLVQYDQITGWIPVFLFAMLFGLSMDYEVFLVTRMREEWDATKDNAQAVAHGLAKTGRLITAAGLIMVAAFMGFVVGSFIELQQFGLGLAAAIFIDVTIVRTLLLPSAMTLLGRWNWWLPARVARVFRVEPSPLEKAPKAVLRPTGT
jgi:RND superfamily putative drug exporter